MTTIKSYTDIEQSKKLAEILSIESADMYYFLVPTPAGNIYHLVVQIGTKNIPQYDKGDIPCWSLAALLNVIPGGQVNRMVNSYKWEASSWNDLDFEPTYYVEGYDNAIDACYEMIVKLNEPELL